MQRSRHHVNPCLLSVLLINRAICLTEMNRAAVALADILHLSALPADAQGCGSTAAHFETLAMVLIDLADFKAINDTHGHPAGDTLLAAFGQMLAARARKSDTACRYGGEEFCLLLPRTTAAAARRLTQALLRLWREQVFSFGATPLPAQSFSAGVADSLQYPVSPALLLQAADDQLLATQRAGRQRVLAADGLPPQSLAPA